MGSCRSAALTVLLLAFALFPGPASARVLQGEKPSSSEGAPAPTDGTGGSEKGQEGGALQASAQPVPFTNAHKGSPPPGGPEPTGGTDREGGGSLGTEKCEDRAEKCLIQGKLFACLQVSQTASIGSFVIVKNTGQNTITVDIKATSDIKVEELPPLTKGDTKRVNITYSNPNGGEITLSVGNEPCVLRVRQPVSDWQQQFQQLAAYATSMNPIYGAYFFVFTVVLVGAVCACCKFARRRRDGGVPYQQLEMGSQALNSSGANNTTSTVDGWEDGWDDDWDDEEAPAKPSDIKPSGSVSANGLSLRSQTNSKDGWDVDWDV